MVIWDTMVVLVAVQVMQVPLDTDKHQPFLEAHACIEPTYVAYIGVVAVSH